MLTEVQLAFVIVMTIMAILLAFIVPRYTVGGKVYELSRKLLVAGAILIAIHFIIQYVLSKQASVPLELRTSINLMFGFPVAFCIHMSLIYLQRRGMMKRKLWYVIPALFVMALVSYIYLTLHLKTPESVNIANAVINLFYMATRVFCTVLEIMGYVKLERSIRLHGNKSFRPIVKWTKGSMLLFTVVSLGFPIMPFIPDPLWRALYGILSMIAIFFYMFSFIGYGVSVSPRRAFLASVPDADEKVQEGAPATSSSVNEVQPASTAEPHQNEAVSSGKNMKLVQTAAERFVKEEKFTTPGITVKEAADSMSVSVYLLKLWLSRSEYGKFTNWIQTLRIAKAKKILTENPDTPGNQIAKLCGYCDRQYFQRSFQREEGMTPLQWVTTNKQNER